MFSKLDLIPSSDKRLGWNVLLDLFDGAVGYFFDTNCMGKYGLHVAYSYSNLEFKLLKKQRMGS